MANLKDLQKSLETSAGARAKFLADLLSTLEKNGVDVNDKSVIESMNLNLDLRDGKEYIKGLTMSSNIITLIA
jgi:hypothetical protein